MSECWEKSSPDQHLSWSTTISTFYWFRLWKVKELVPRNVFELKLVTCTVYPVQSLKLCLKGIYVKDLKIFTRWLWKYQDLKMILLWSMQLEYGLYFHKISTMIFFLVPNCVQYIAVWNILVIHYSCNLC